MAIMAGANMMMTQQWSLLFAGDSVQMIISNNQMRYGYVIVPA